MNLHFVCVEWSIQPSDHVISSLMLLEHKKSNTRPHCPRNISSSEFSCPQFNRF